MKHIQSNSIEIQRRIFQIERAVVELDTQTLRKKWITQLDNLFNLATSIASPDNSSGPTRNVTPKERQMWAQIATRIGEVMVHLSRGYDDQQFNEDLAELERQVNEIKELQTQTDRATDQTAETKQRSPLRNSA